VRSVEGDTKGSLEAALEKNDRLLFALAVDQIPRWRSPQNRSGFDGRQGRTLVTKHCSVQRKMANLAEDVLGGEVRA
jgi:hypothetical protein